MKTIRFTVKKTPGIAEWQARFHIDGKYMPAWTVYETDKQSATDSAVATVERFNACELASLQDRHIDDIDED